MESLGASFAAQARAALAGHPGLAHHWEVDGAGCGSIHFPAAPGGFEVAVEIEADQVTVHAGGAHDHFECAPNEPDVAAVAAAALGLVRDLLSPDMRVRELRAGERPYRVHIERRSGQGWAVESTTGLLVWNYFAARSERIYQNRHLAGRLASPAP